MSRTLARILFAAAVCLPPSAVFGQAPPAPVTRPRTAAEDLQLFSQVFNQIRVNHPDSLDSHRLFLAAIQAMVQATDPHSYVIPAVRLSAGKEAELRAGKLHPLPISFAVVGGTPIVAAVAAGTDARRQDILIGDELVTVDGKPVQVDSPLELEIQLAGPRGSYATLGLERRRPDGIFAPLTRRVKREKFSGETAIPASLMLDSETGYVRVTSFDNDKVADDLRKSISTLAAAGMKQMILDLRGNGGGLVNEAAAVAGEFLPTGTIVYTSEGRRAETADTGRVKRSFWKSERDYPLVVMIDEGTASASELVAGALQDHDRALIVGQPSFGKSLLMRGFPLSDGSVLVLVIGQVHTPCGRAVQRQYREVSNRNYYRAARAERDTVGRPTCKSKSGRTLYGGGGIYPDVRLPRPTPDPAWANRAAELDLPIKWANTLVGASANTLGTLEGFAANPALPDAAVAQFRAMATESGVTIPDDAESDAKLRSLLYEMVAYVRWGNQGVYTLEARTDPEIREAMKNFPTPKKP